MLLCILLPLLPCIINVWHRRGVIVSSVFVSNNSASAYARCVCFHSVNLLGGWLGFTQCRVGIISAVDIGLYLAIIVLVYISLYLRLCGTYLAKRLLH
jgi:hypothetical protein